MARYVVTGANRGIGLEVCTQLAARGDEVLAACRTRSDGLDAVGVEVIEGVDVQDDDGLRALVSGVGDRSVDVLVLNAGVMRYESIDGLDLDAIRLQFEVNALGPLRATIALLDRLDRGARVVVVTSRMGSIEDNTSGGYYGYRMSKAAVNMAARSLAVDLRERGIAVRVVHPGMVATDMTSGRGVPVSESARGLIARIDETHAGTSGTFVHANGEPLPW